MDRHSATPTRREFCTAATGTALVGLSATAAKSEPRARRSDLPPGRFQLRYILASAMYGTSPLAEILAEVRKTAPTPSTSGPESMATSASRSKRWESRPSSTC